MGCAGSTPPAHGHPSAGAASSGASPPIAVAVAQQTPPVVTPVVTPLTPLLGNLPLQQQQQRQQQVPRQDAIGNLKAAPLVRSLVSLQKGNCGVERDASGWYLRFGCSASAPGEATSFFLTKASSSSNKLETLGAEQVSNQRFEANMSQSCRLYLCEDLPKSLEGYAIVEDKTRHQLVLDLRADSADSRTVAVQRYFFKFGEGNSLQVVKQQAKCGTSVRDVEALYGTLPNPRQEDNTVGETNLNDADGGDCVICLSKPREVAILHCRHVCLCNTCAKITSSTWSFQCPVCRGRVSAMVGLEEAAKG